MTRPRVYLVQEPARLVAGEWVPKYDLSAAEAFGEVVRVLPHGNLPMDLTEARGTVESALRGYSGERDFVLLLGDPVAIALVVDVIARDWPLDGVRLLKWDRRRCCYDPVKLA